MLTELERETESQGGRSVKPVRRRWKRIALAMSIALILVAGVGVAFLRQGPHVVTVDDAVQAFRSKSTTTTDGAPASGAAGSPAGATAAQGAAPAPAAPPTSPPAAPSATPPPAAARASAAPAAASGGAAPPAATPAQARKDIAEGVYRFQTQGYEQTNALGGARHDYPAETPMTVRKAACGGWTQRWQPLQERWDESDLCFEGDNVSVRRFTTYHEFFQRSQQQDFTCPAGSHVQRYAATAGQTWTWECKSSSGGIVTNVTMIGREPITVAGQKRDSYHLRYESTLSGSNRGTQKQDRWLDAESGMNLKIVTDIDTEADSPFGAVHYEEHYTIVLASLTPEA